jgi:hypothetical protein
MEMARQRLGFGYWWSNNFEQPTLAELLQTRDSQSILPVMKPTGSCLNHSNMIDDAARSENGLAA